MGPNISPATQVKELRPAAHTEDPSACRRGEDERRWSVQLSWPDAGHPAGAQQIIATAFVVIKTSFKVTVSSEWNNQHMSLMSIV